MHKKTYAMRYIAGQPVERIFQPDGSLHLGQAVPAGAPLLAEKTLYVLVWNIYKQQRLDWLSVLRKFASGVQLVLLQEAQTTPELIQFATDNYLAADQVPAFVLPQHPCGVMTLATAHPVYCCPLLEREPLLRLSKSALITTYPLPGGDFVMVVNIHAVNFSFGVDIYSKQLEPIGEQILSHRGPVIMAGDFNAWSRQRKKALYRFAHKMSLHEVHFSNDLRRKAFGYPLDFIFYRGLQVADADVFITKASDHNPLLVAFAINTTDVHR